MWTAPFVPSPRSIPTPYDLACHTTPHSWNWYKHDCRQLSESHRLEYPHCLQSNPPTSEHLQFPPHRVDSLDLGLVQFAGYTLSGRVSFYIRGALDAYLGFPSFSYTFRTLTYTSFPSFGGGMSRGYWLGYTSPSKVYVGILVLIQLHVSTRTKEPNSKTRLTIPRWMLYMGGVFMVFSMLSVGVVDLSTMNGTLKTHDDGAQSHSYRMRMCLNRPQIQSQS